MLQRRPDLYRITVGQISRVIFYAFFGPVPVHLLLEGYAVASINYRLSSETLLPAQLEDCKAAIRWLRAHADEFGIDPNRIGVWGASAGGNLAALVGTTGEVRDFEVGEKSRLPQPRPSAVRFLRPHGLSPDGRAPSSGRANPQCAGFAGIEVGRWPGPG